jgi:hypothetical protein
LETSTLLSYPWGQMNGQNISLWSRILSEDQKEKITDIYYGVNISFNNPESDTHLVCLNFFSENDLSEVLKKITGKKMLFYYQNQNLHTDNNNKELELQTKLDYYSKTIQNFTGFSWWTYIRHFIIWN